MSTAYAMKKMRSAPSYRALKGAGFVPAAMPSGSIRLQRKMADGSMYAVVVQFQPTEGQAPFTDTAPVQLVFPDGRRATYASCTDISRVMSQNDGPPAEGVCTCSTWAPSGVSGAWHIVACGR